MSRKSKLVRIDKSLDEIYKQFKKNGEVETFPEFTRMLAKKLKIKDDNLRFFK